MNITKNDLFYILISIVVASIGVVAVSNTSNRIGLYGLLGLLGIAVVMTIIIKPSLGANILVFVIYTNISDLLTKHGLPGIIKPLVVIVAFALLVRYIYIGQVPIGHAKTARVEYFLLAYFMIVIASFLVASDKDAALTDIMDMGKDIIIIYCILFALRQPQAWKQTIWLIMVTTALLCSLTVYQIIAHNYQQDFFGLSAVIMDKVFGDSTTPRIGGPINAPNLWGQILVAVSTLLIFRIIHEKSNLIKFVTLFMLGIILFVVLNTYSRGAYLVLAIDVILIFFVFEKRFNPVVAFAGLGVLILLLPFIPATYRDRFYTLSDFTAQNGIYQDTSFRGRSSEMLTGLAMFAEHPLLGVGTANYPTNYQRYAQLIGIEFRATARDPHSLYIQVLAETGILGAIAFLGLVFFLIDALNRTIRAIERSPHLSDWLPWMNAIRLAILSYLMTSFILHNAYIRYFWILVAMALAGIQITYTLLNNSERNLSIEARR
ncbi:MAG TPA: O-antigen ligase family protein [Anaerolineales bacterium]|nr:O-antigen ligase family protein [Anaerolineales bacterium]HLO28647.1 O-antigen ligase family protein [Anaerolineales bacterium]